MSASLLADLSREVVRATRVRFSEWTQSRPLSSIGTNSGSPELPFQGWKRVKEAFAPEVVERAVASSRIQVRRCLDPFGGSGTTSLACQFLGVLPLTMEVNPYLADLIEAKLTTYDADHLARDLQHTLQHHHHANRSGVDLFRHAPATFVEPGVGGRWLFDVAIANQIAKLHWSINSLAEPAHRRFFRVLLGGVLLDVSNVVVSGKGRRYRRGWQDRTSCDDHALVQLFAASAKRAITDVHRFRNRSCKSYALYRGDCRVGLVATRNLRYDLAVFSPPYPNSFDYTDVYNVELWGLGYLSGKAANRTLRHATLSSHVQVARAYAPPPQTSQTLIRTLRRLADAQSTLWHKDIPAMVGAYFTEMGQLTERLAVQMRKKGSAWIVVGDSRYADITIPTATIISEIAESQGWRTTACEPFRAIRASPQQGGRRELSESLLVLQKA